MHYMHMAPFNLQELASYIQNLNTTDYRVVRFAQAQLWKYTSGAWPTLCVSIMSRVPLPIVFPNGDLNFLQHTRETWNPAMWLASEGWFTLEDVVPVRYFTVFIDVHWKRILSQSGKALNR